MSDNDTKTPATAGTHNGHDQPTVTHRATATRSHGHGHDHPKGLRGAIKEIFAPHSHDAADSVDMRWNPVRQEYAQSRSVSWCWG